jgi:hypothetical protein
MSKIKSKENIEDTVQLTSSQIAKAVSDAKKISESDVAGKTQSLIDWSKQIEELKNNPPKSVEEAVARIIASTADNNSTAEQRQMLTDVMLSNPHIINVVKNLVR